MITYLNKGNERFMNKDNLIIGSHVNMGAPLYYLGSVKEALSYGSTAFMFYTGAPQNTMRTPLSQLKIEEGRKLLLENNIEEKNIVVHAPYIINPANMTKPELYKMSIDVITNELRRTSAFNVKSMVLHPGSHVGQGKDIGIKALANALDEVFAQDGTEVKIALETMAGKGNEIGICFEDIKQIISLSHFPERLGVCLDTCHINDAGYEVKDVDKLLEEFDAIIGLDKLLVVHLNDSKNPIGAHKDRHENLGYGYIGFKALNALAHHPKLKDIPKILESPYINDKPPFKAEISMLKNEEFIDGWKEKYYL